MAIETMADNDFVHHVSPSPENTVWVYSFSTTGKVTCCKTGVHGSKLVRDTNTPVIAL